MISEFFKKDSAFYTKVTQAVRQYKIYSFCLLAPILAFGSWYDQKLEGWYYFEDKESSERKHFTSPEEADSYGAHEQAADVGIKFIVF